MPPQCRAGSSSGQAPGNWTESTRKGVLFSLQRKIWGRLLPRRLFVDLLPPPASRGREKSPAMLAGRAPCEDNHTSPRRVVPPLTGRSEPGKPGAMKGHEAAAAPAIPIAFCGASGEAPVDRQPALSRARPAGRRRRHGNYPAWHVPRSPRPCPARPGAVHPNTRA